jgi:hypothetical protein
MNRRSLLWLVPLMTLPAIIEGAEPRPKVGVPPMIFNALHRARIKAGDNRFSFMILMDPQTGLAMRGSSMVWGKVEVVVE